LERGKADEQGFGTVKQKAEIVGGGLAELSAEARLIGAGKAGLDLLEQIVWRLFGFPAFQRMRVVRGASCGAHRREALEERGRCTMMGKAGGKEHEPNNRAVSDKDMEKLNAELKEFDDVRDTLIKRSRDVVKSAKSAIYCLHRNHLDNADSLMCSAENTARELLDSHVQSHPWLRSQPIFSSGIEELVEARIFQHFLLHGSIPPSSSFSFCDREEYIGGVLDFTGELNRYTVMQATKRNIHEVLRCRDIVDTLTWHFLQFDFRNNHLRKKHDTLKYTANKLQNLCYEQTLSRGRVEEQDDPPAQPDAAAMDDNDDA
jgi:predicted translin family RNA/ssDNA-binding protein